MPKTLMAAGANAMEVKQISTKETCIINRIHLKAIRNYFLLGYLLLLLLCIVLIHLFAVGFFCQVIFFFLVCVSHWHIKEWHEKFNVCQL